MTEPARVLSVIGDLGFGGAEDRLLSLARTIDRERFEHTVLTLNPDDPADPGASAMKTFFEEAGIRVKPLGASGDGKISRFAGRIRRLCRVIRRHNIDVVDAHCESAALIGACAGLITGKPCIATLYHPHPLQPPRFWPVAEQFFLANVALVITDSVIKGKEIQETSLFRRPEVVVIPNGPWPPIPTCDARNIRHQFNIPGDPKVRVIGQISSLREFKGQMVLLEAARVLLEQYPNVILLLAGYEDSPQFRARLERRAAELGISEKVRLGGYPGPIGDVWNVIDIHVHASLFDSLPNAILEGMSLGKPAVVTSVGGVPDAVIDGETGLVVPPGNPSALASALLRVLREPGFASKLGEGARSRYERLYRPEHMTRKLESCFSKVIDRCSTWPP
jgi:glycosyltransferase involved in cell wall biosynthesis